MRLANRVGAAHADDSAGYPHFVYMNYSWSEEARQTFLKEPHRGRYLRSNFLINPPPDITPLVAVQYVDSPYDPIFRTSQPSILLIVVEEVVYLVSTQRWQEVVGVWPRGRKRPKARDADLRLERPALLFPPWRLRYPDQTSNRAAKRATLSAALVASMEDMFAAFQNNLVVQEPTFFCSDLRALLPRPEAPSPGIPLGTVATFDDIPSQPQ